MKKTIFSLVALACAATTTAQVQSDIRTATLIHGEHTFVYYGATAFADAYTAAAAAGDVIVLSSGNFNAPDIEKSVAIYGAGYETDPISGAGPTTIRNILIRAKRDYDSDGNIIEIYPTVDLEGLCLNGHVRIENSSNDTIIADLTVKKCRLLGGISFNARSRNCKFSQCVIGTIGNQTSSVYSVGLTKKQEQLNFENCWIDIAAGSSLASTITYNHCIIKSFSNGSYANSYAHVTNSIVNSTLYDNCTATNNIFTTSTIGTNVTGAGNWTGVAVASIFIDAEQGFAYSATNDFALCVPEIYRGTDGTEVGINGGIAPFHRISSLPRILSSDIDLRTTEDGKLNVSIQVQAQTGK